VRTVAFLFFGFFFHPLCGQSVDDPEFRLSPQLNPGEVDISHTFKTKGIQKVKLFNPEGIRRANMVLLMERGSFDKDVDATEGGIDIYQLEFDLQGRPVSGEQIKKRNYDFEADRYVGFHSIDIRYEYKIDGSSELHYIDSQKGLRYVWYYQDDLISKCELFSGQGASLTAYWIWEYQNDTLLTDFKKFDYRDRVEYHFVYKYDKHGRLNHVLKNFSKNEMHLSIYERDTKLETITHYESLDDVFGDCYKLIDGLLIKNYGCNPRRRIKAEKQMWIYNSEGLPLKVQKYSGTGGRSATWEYTYNAAGLILEETYSDDVITYFTTRYTYTAENELSKIEYFKGSGNYPKEWASFEYNEKGNVSRWSLMDQYTFEMEYHYFE